MSKEYLPHYNSLNEKEKTFWLDCTKEELIDHFIANVKNGEKLLAELEILQQAKDKLQNDYQNAVDKINKLQQENKQLEENYERIYNENCKLRENHNINDISLLDENEQLEQKIDKAIEYIKNHSNKCMFELRTEELEELLKILGDKEK